MGLIELTGFGDLLRMIGVLFWGLAIGALVMALTLPKTRKGKATATLIVVGLFAALPGRSAWEAKQQRDTYQKAEAMFQERCKKSGVFIYRTAENVEGVFLLKFRPKGINYGDQYKMDDPYGSDSTGENYIKGFFRDPMLLANQHKPEILERLRREYLGYRYVDAIDPEDGKRYRYTGRLDEPWKRRSSALEGHRIFVLDKVLAPDPAPRYGVTYDDISTREERDYWIAGSSLKVIDLQTQEVMAERIGYMMDRGQGKPGYGGSEEAWLRAASYACPDFRPSGARQPGFSYQAGQTRNFVKKILKPILEK